MSQVEQNTIQRFIFCEHQLLLRQTGTTYRLPELTLAEATQSVSKWHAIGRYHQRDCYAGEADRSMADGSSYCWLPLKQAIEVLGLNWFSAAARAYQVLNWAKNHQFCGQCGSKTVTTDVGFERQCSSCQLSFYPRISPSIIVLIKKGDQILLARQASFKPGVYALIAGFVEVGETLEETVHREVAEEVGITVANVRYFSSQPWPFPDSLMIAFTADYQSGDIELVDGEIEEAGWYHADNLPGLPSSYFSVSRQLIDAYLAEQLAEQAG